MSDIFPFFFAGRKSPLPLLQLLHAICAKTICSACSKCSNRRWLKLTVATRLVQRMQQVQQGGSAKIRPVHKLAPTPVVSAPRGARAPRPSNTTPA